MNIGAISGDSQVYGVRPAASAGQAQAAQAAPATLGTSPDQANVSQTGTILSQLLDLQKTDPDKFKQLTAKISDDLANAAKNSADPRQGALLGAMAQRFGEASKTGEMPTLTAGKGHNGHHCHKGYAKAMASQDGEGLSGLMSQVSSIISGDMDSVLGTSGSSSGTTGATTSAAQTAGAAQAAAAVLPPPPPPAQPAFSALFSASLTSPTLTALVQGKAA